MSEKEKQEVFRERTDSVDHPLKEKTKRKRRNSSDKSSDNMECTDQMSQVLDELKRIRQDIDELKTTRSDPKVMQETSELRTEIAKIKDLVRDVKDCLESVEVKFGILEKRLDKQEKTSEKLDKRIDNVYTRLDAQSKEVHNLREDLRKTKDRVIDTESVVEKSTDSIKQSQTSLKKINEKTIDLSARGRRLNIIFHGIKESSDENSDTCKQKVKDFIKEKCNISENVHVEVAHRLGARKQDGSAATKPRPMIAKFSDRGVRDSVMRTKKDLPEGFGMTQDFPYEIRMGRRQLIPKMLQAIEQKKEAWIAYPCRLFIDGREVERIEPSSLSR